MGKAYNIVLELFIGSLKNMNLNSLYSSVDDSSDECTFESTCIEQMHDARIKKKINFSLYIMKFRMEQLQSHI